jgi:hypothetical protein
MKQIIRLENELKIASQQVAEAEEYKSMVEDKKNEIASQITHEKENTFDKEKEFNDLTKQYELEKEKEIVLQSDKYNQFTHHLFLNPFFSKFCLLIKIRATLELSLKHILADKKLEYDSYNRAVKDKERELKNLKKLELQLRAYQDSLYNIKLQHEKILNQVCFEINLKCFQSYA